MAIIDGKIKCSKCGELKDIGLYQPSIVKRGCGSCRDCKYQAKLAWESKNRDKANAYARGRRARNKDQYLAATRKWRQENPDKIKSYNLKKEYGITKGDYDNLLEMQDWKCACCGIEANRNGRRLYVDHCHQTMAIRGILCHKCNSGIGALGDTIEGIEMALAYMKRGACHG